MDLPKDRVGLNLNEEKKKKKREKNQRITNHLSKRNFIKHATYKVDLPLKIASFVFMIVSFGRLVLILFLLEW